VQLTLHPVPKVIEAIRRKAPQAFLVAFKAESDAKTLKARATERLKRYQADAILANLTASFGAATTTLHVLTPRGKPTSFRGAKRDVLEAVVALLAPRRRPAGSAPAVKPTRRAASKPTRPAAASPTQAAPGKSSGRPAASRKTHGASKAASPSGGARATPRATGARTRKAR
jgi:hypothetical protein